MEKYKEVYDKWLDVNAELYNECKQYLIDTLSKVEGNSLDLSNEDYNYCSVPYDGGNHPEYASDCFATVDGVYLKDGEVFLSIEETDEYEIDRIDAINLCDVANAVYNTVTGDLC